MVRDVLAQDVGLGSRAREHHLMSAERHVYALTDWMVERRATGWYFSRYRGRQTKAGWRGPYSSEAQGRDDDRAPASREIVQRSQPSGQMAAPRRSGRSNDA